MCVRAACWCSLAVVYLSLQACSALLVALCVSLVACSFLLHGHGSKPMVPFWDRRTTRFRTYFCGDWDVHWGYRFLTHGHMSFDLFGAALVSSWIAFWFARYVSNAHYGQRKVIPNSMRMCEREGRAKI